MKRLFCMAEAFLLSVCVLVGCNYTDDETEAQVSAADAENNYESAFIVTKADTNTNTSEAVRIDLSELDGECIISEAGSYLLTGTMSGKILIDAEDQIVHLILDDISVRCASGAALSVMSAGKVIITLNEDSVNNLRDSGTYNTDGEENACIYSTCDLTFNGLGILNIHGDYKDGIHSKDVVKVLGGDITIQAKRDGIRGNDGILICGDSLDIESEGTGLHTTKAENEKKGVIEISGGNVSIISGEYAIHSLGNLCVKDCSIFAKGILSKLRADGDSFIQEECLKNE
ncbi:MAG: carbohydrate-binding domain-containing protein [Lachnospiraceae bacterium]|nr:carbohydrate-binding domain-containing protein [Lachnospiraceae bacterium]